VNASTVTASATPEAFAAAVKAPRLEASVASELNVLWRSVFERVHAAERQHDQGSEPPRSGVAARSARNAQAFALDAETNSNAGADGLERWHPAASRPHSNLPPLCGGGQGGGAAASVASNAQPLASTPESPIVSVTLVHPLARDAQVGPPPAERARPADVAPRARAPSADTGEAVNVFVQQGVVAIAVRNARLTDDEALRCAFETACTLAGERAALQELTLNGRTVYRQSPPPDSAASPTLAFAC
jgi:hypothetical protein